MRVEFPGNQIRIILSGRDLRGLLTRMEWRQPDNFIHVIADGVAICVEAEDENQSQAPTRTDSERP